MTPTNSTEKLLMDIANDNSRSIKNKKIFINEAAYPDQEANYAAGKPCAVCPPPQARPEFVENLIRSLDKRYIVTIYAAYPGTPLNDDFGKPKFDKDERVTSAAGHMWYEISDRKSINPYGFVPKTTGMTGPGAVTEYDTKHYEKPRYSRTLEITKEQYNKLKEYGDLAIAEKNPDFDLYYKGHSNSCIDFTWKVLRSAGLKSNFLSSEHSIALNPATALNRMEKINGDFEGKLKVAKNIPHIESIPAPFPNSELNTEHYNAPPKLDLLKWEQFKQWNLTQADTNDTDIKIS
ncbi:conserved hypothetical protein [Xenorhabdus bovienii str. puntauvense]|uniref:Uncharacterized protein n=1 Tax=Xenorhabdus bovienii str. puntauvense TaxID=1398201 RepID=A0A077ND67_XENBV|nr:hypothetical protein [Xenorhabdus bovienii]CDG96162.1 conserved hypothetical protein [Xenorhabdus bovienii str. puntauvense]